MTVTVKATGSIDPIRSALEIVITPSYKNYLGQVDLAKDANSRAELKFASTDPTLNPVNRVTLKDAKQANTYALRRLEDGTYVLSFRSPSKSFRMVASSPSIISWCFA